MHFMYFDIKCNKEPKYAKNTVITKKYSLVLYKRIDAQFVEYTPVVNIGVNMA